MALQNLLRIRMDALRRVKGRLFLGASPFTGVVYAVESQHVISNALVQEGVLGETHEEWPRDIPRVLEEAIALVDEESDAGPEPGAYLNDEPFRGFAYQFAPQGNLLSEYRWNRYGPADGREWYRSGQLRRVYQGAATEHWSIDEWHENGLRHSFHTDAFMIAFTPEGLLLALAMKNRDLPEPYSGPFEANRRLLMSGLGVDDSLLAVLQGLERVTELHLRGTSLTRSGLQRLGMGSHLEKLSTAQNQSFTSQDVRQLLVNTPGCDWEDRDELLARQ